MSSSVDELDRPATTTPPLGRHAHLQRPLTSRRTYRRRRILTVVAPVLGALLLWLAVSLGGALTDPALGTSLSSRFAEWTRGHGGTGAAAW